MTRTISFGALHLRPTRGCGERPPTASDLRAQADQQWPFLDKYCVECHSSSELAANLAFDNDEPGRDRGPRRSWEKVVRKLRGRMMPPPGGNHPEAPEIDAFVAWLEANLDQGSAEQHAGYVPLHRLNRTEYANAIRDLLALDVDPTTLLPVDGPKTVSTTSRTRSSFRRRSSTNTSPRPAR